MVGCMCKIHGVSARTCRQKVTEALSVDGQRGTTWAAQKNLRETVQLQIMSSRWFGSDAVNEPSMESAHGPTVGAS
jgi:hypothetical protein